MKWCGGHCVIASSGGGVMRYRSWEREARPNEHGRIAIVRASRSFPWARLIDGAQAGRDVAKSGWDLLSPGIILLQLTAGGERSGYI
jgi:hypothetical protein